jgi:hypothetical protein
MIRIRNVALRVMRSMSSSAAKESGPLSSPPAAPGTQAGSASLCYSHGV